VYQTLVGAYPRRFRLEYGSHMVQLFRDISRRQYGQKGGAGLVELWAATLWDLLRSVAWEHLQKETTMNKMNSGQKSGLAIILGAVLFYSGLVMAISLGEGGADRYMAVYLLLIGLIALSLPLFALGLLGLYRLLPRQVAATLAFAVAEVGLFLYIVGVLILFTTNMVAAAMSMIAVGAVLLGLGMLGLGAVGLINRSLGWWSIAPVLVGAGHIGFITFIVGEGQDPTVLLLAMATLLVGWFLVGIALWTGPAKDRQPGLPA
jgi:hypothetical protein